MTDKPVTTKPAWETIHQAAILREGEIWTLPRPARHHNILWAMHDVDHNTNPSERPKIIEAKGEQGFITKTGRFVDRVMAFDMAVGAGQLIREPCAAPKLYSEDLW